MVAGILAERIPYREGEVTLVVSTQNTAVDALVQTVNGRIPGLVVVANDEKIG